MTFEAGSTISKEEIVSLEGKSVIIADISFAIEELQMIDEIASNVVLFDHHISAKNTLEQLDWAVFDNEESGATLTYIWMVNKFLEAHEEGIEHNDIPILLQYIKDRDLWEKKLPNIEEITMYIRYIYNEGGMDALSYIAYVFPSEAIGIGRILLNSRNQEVDKQVRSISKEPKFSISGLEVPFGLTQSNASEVGHELSKESHVSLTYYMTESYMGFALRSDGTVGVSEIAKQHGGGGHAAAAGFRYKYSEIDISETLIRREIVLT